MTRGQSDRTGTESCYMCASAATSSEHVPPRCIFPHQKDVGTSRYRENLITVPSCDAHNSGKSLDDEFLMMSLAGLIGNNSIGFRHKFTKVNRAFRRKSERFLATIFQRREEFFVPVEGNLFLRVIRGTPHLDRLDRCIDHIVRGLFFHHFATKFDGRVKTHFMYLDPPDSNSREFKRLLGHLVDRDLRNAEALGNNPEVFSYRVSEPDQQGV